MSKGTLDHPRHHVDGSWYILFVKLWEQYKLMREAPMCARVLEGPVVERRREAAGQEKRVSLHRQWP